jgi:hypothetical protein
MKKIITLLLIGLIIPLISAINIDVEKQSSGEVLILELNKPVSFDLKIKNNEISDNFEFYNLLGFSMFPIGTISIDEGQTKEVKLEIYPLMDLESTGPYTLSYYIKGGSSEIKEELTFRIINLKDAFEIGSGEINPTSEEIEIYIHNKVNFDFENIEVKFKSSFFEKKETFSLGPNKREDFTIKLNKEDFNKLNAGFYTLNAEIKIENKTADIEGILEFSEKNLVETKTENYGFVIETNVISKINKGNSVSKSEVILEKNIISRLFTTFSPHPDITERDGLTITYIWNKEIKPGETFEVRVRTNWLFPLLIIFFVVIITILTKQYSKTNLVLKKKVSFVSAKGGEFALKISIFVNAKKYIERVNIIDRLPLLTKIYERFGGKEPSKISEKNRRIEWNFEKLEAGETRILSYIIYSKIGILGKFALPTATAIFERDGKIEESESNRAFFIAEQRRKNIEE